MKICNGPLCQGKKKPATEFNKNKSRKDGLAGWCKECRKKYHQDHAKEISEYGKKYRQTLDGRYSEYKRGAKWRNLNFTLTLKQFETLTSQPCHYCGDYTEGKEFCGIDRVDNNIGYVLSNCIPCCTTCNFMRQNLSSEKYVTHCLKVAAHHKDLLTF